MPSVRLNNDLRESFCNSLLRHRFSEEFAGLMKDRAALANAIWLDLYKPSERATIESLPAGWMPEFPDISVRFGPYGYERLFFNGDPQDLRFLLPNGKAPEPVLIRMAAKHNGCAKVYDTGHKLQVRHAALKDAEKDFHARLKTAQREMAAVIGSVSTTARLKEIWPEAAPFVSAIEKSSPALPAPPIADLNKTLGLPVKDAA